MNQMKEIVFETIQADLKEAGFKLVKTRDWFIRKDKHISFVFWVVPYLDQGHIRLTPTCGVRFNEVEDIFHKCSGFEEKYQKYTLTLVSEIWRWKRQVDLHQYILKTEDDVQNIATQILQNFKHDALKYFESYSTLVEVDSVFNSEPDQECIHQIMDFARCSRGIIVAKLCNRSNYEELVEIYRKRMLNQDKGFYLNPFDCINNLLTNW